jgi:hypothetical protein
MRSWDTPVPFVRLASPEFGQHRRPKPRVVALDEVVEPVDRAAAADRILVVERRNQLGR